MDLLPMLQKIPYWDTISTLVVIANLVTASLKDKYAESIPILGKIWPVLNWMSVNIGHNENNKNGMGR